MTKLLSPIPYKDIFNSKVNKSGKTEVKIIVSNPVSGRVNRRSVYRDREGNYFIYRDKRRFSSSEPNRMYLWMFD